jgi:cytochrome c
MVARRRNEGTAADGRVTDRDRDKARPRGIDSRPIVHKRRIIMKLRLVFLSAVLATAAGIAHAGDAKKGAVVFKKCQSCHTATEAKNRIGPSLLGIVGRQVATVDKFKYSKAMKEFGAGKTWDEPLLTTYLAAPRDLVKGTTMAFAGLKKPEEIADVVAYLKDPAAAE